MKDVLVIIDDDVKFLNELKSAFSDRFELKTTSEYFQGQDILTEYFNIALIDIKLSNDDETKVGLNLIKTARESNPNSIIVMMTAYPTIDIAVDAFRLGADDFIQKKKTPLEAYPLLIQKIIEKKKLNTKISYLKNTINELRPIDFIGNDAKILEIKNIIKHLAQKTNVNVLITGESGVGKELVAYNIHIQGPRKEEPFVAVPLSTLHAETINSSLFGHVKGAYTGADSNKIGYIESANKGTLLLDEIGELPLETQAKLLRVIELKEFTPLGEIKPRSADIHIIAATNRNLLDMVNSGKFREDLYYRLSLFEIKIPPLRERKKDVPQLIDYYLRILCRKYNIKNVKIDENVYNILINFDWPGNVRQLFNTLEYSVIRIDKDRDDIVTFNCLPDWLKNPDTSNRPLEINLSGFKDIKKELARYELEIVWRVILESDMKKTEIHSILGLSNRFLLPRRLKRIFDNYPEFKEKYDALYLLYFKNIEKKQREK